MSSKTVDFPPNIAAELKKFRFKRNNSHAAVSLKINKTQLIVEIDETFDALESMEDLAEELPSNSPRYVVVSYQLTHKDGRTSNPLFLLNWNPTGCPTELAMLHGSALSSAQIVADVSKVIEIREEEDLTTEAVEKALLG